MQNSQGRFYGAQSKIPGADGAAPSSFAKGPP